MAKGYWVSVYRTNPDPDGLAAYNELAGVAVRAEGGRTLSRDGRILAYEGGNTHRVVLVEFDSFEQAVAARESEAYQKALAALPPDVERDFRIVEELTDGPGAQPASVT